MGEPYYDIAKHSYMRYDNDRLADFVHERIDNSLINAYDTAIELGAGMGRFSAPLLRRFRRVVLEEPVPAYFDLLMRRFYPQASISKEPAESFLKSYSGGPAAVYCFHLMHHLPREIRDKIYAFVRLNRGLGILVEPNPLNPLLLLQILLTKDMSFWEERRYLVLGRGRYASELAANGLEILHYERFLVTPPVLANTLLQMSAKNIVMAIESLRKAVPFLCSYQLILFGCQHEG
ncbi:MAG: class I SAM-dependent methyltransferase [Proteobacteria bacterium]|nr:class I SAM-dependent methyltransferase [Pseudomonadota bacterium]